MVVNRTLFVEDVLQEIKQIEAYIRGHENSIANLKKKIARIKEMKK